MVQDNRQYAYFTVTGDFEPSAITARVGLELSRELDGCMQLVGYWFQGYPGLHFDAEMTRGLARYDVAVDFDFTSCTRTGLKTPPKMPLQPSSVAPPRD